MRMLTLTLAGAAAMMFAAAPEGSAKAPRREPLPRSAPDREGVSSVRLAHIDERYRTGVQAGEIPGAMVLIARNGQLVYARAFGFADRAAGLPLTPDTIFALASMTKPITSVAVMMLVEEGRVALDEPVSRYMPEFRNLKVVVETVEPDGRRSTALEPVAREPTVQDLMRHTAGFVYGQFGDLPIHRQYRLASLLDSQVPLAETMSRLAKLPLAHQPGSTFEYSIATDVLGRLIEVVSGEPLDQFIARRITGPLRMSSTGFHVPAGALFAWPDSPDPAARARATPSIGTNPALLSGGGGLYGTAGDYLRFAQMLLNEGELDGVRILAPHSVRLMTSDHLSPGLPIASNSAALLRVIAPSAEMGQGFGLGFAVRVTDGHNPMPGSVGDFYWAGATGTYFWADPAERLAVVALTAQPRPNVKVLYRQLARQLVYQALERVAPRRIDAGAGRGGGHTPTAPQKTSARSTPAISP